MSNARTSSRRITRLGDTPINVAANQRAATIEVNSNLAEDTIIAEGLDIGTDRTEVALFTNPFSGREEMLYVDGANRLQWVRHANASSMAPAPDEPDGWTTVLVAPSAHDVEVAVHPNGEVWAFILVGDLPHQGSAMLAMTRLELDPGEPGGQRWGSGGFTGEPLTLDGSFLSLQYCNDRLHTPIVFTHVPSQATLNWCVPVYPGHPEDEVPWQTVGQSMAYDLAGRNAPVVAGADLMDLASPSRPQLAVVRVWTLVDSTLTMTSMFPRNGSSVTSEVTGVWERLVSVWSHPQGAGVIVAHDTGGGNTQLGFVLLTPGTDDATNITILTVDQLDDIAAWQDADGLLHLYGRGADDTLQVLHQTGWNTDGAGPVFGVMAPVFEQHLVEPSYMPTLRPLVGDVAFFAVDAYPDQMPNQVVRHQDAAAGEGFSFYTQSTRTSFWAEEKVRIVPDRVPTPYAVTRYETTLTVKDGYGTPLHGCDLHLTSDAPIDLEIAGRFYRTGTTTPIVLTTDLRGKVTLRTLATGLYVPQMHVTAPGLGQSLSLQQAADVHAFLGGSGTLPNHADGFTADVVSGAKSPSDPKKPLFPVLQRDPASAATWPPTAQDVVTWCQAAFAVDGGTGLPAALLEGLAEGDQVRAFTLQTHDPARRGLEVYTRAEHLAARRESLRAQGFLTELEDWLGDLWEGIKQGVTTVYEVLVDLELGVIEVCIELADGVKAFFTAVWDSLVSAAHAVESVFVAIGAKIDEVLAWLSWLFDFDDIWATKTALDGGIEYVRVPLLQTIDLFKDFGDAWFQAQEEHVRAAFEAMKDAVGSRTFAGLGSPVLPDDKNPPAKALVQDTVSDPHLSWLFDQLHRSGASTGGVTHPSLAGDDDPFTTFIEAIVASPGWKSFGLAADDALEVVTTLFDPADPQTIAAEELVSLLDMFENLVVGVLEIGDTALDAVVTFVEDALALIDELLATPIESDLLESIYTYVQQQAGVPLDKIVKPTVGGVATLLAAFPTTILSKVVIGRAPFPSGTLPEIPYDRPPAPGELGETAESGGVATFPGGTLIPPPAWGAVMGWQVFQGLMMAIDGPFDAMVDASAYYDDEDDIPWLLQIDEVMAKVFGGLHFIAYAVGDCPWIWGNTFPIHVPADPTWLPPASWVGSIVNNLADVCCAFKNGYFLAKFDQDKTGVGPGTLTLSGVIREGISAARYLYLGSQSSTDVLNLAINTTSFESSATGMLRFWFRRNPELEILMNVKVFVDLVCDLFAGITTTYQTIYSDGFPPHIAYGGDALPDATLGQPYSYQFQASGGWEPYHWDGAGVRLPAGLSLDAQTGVLSGTPTQRGEFVIRVQVTDYSGPSFTFLTDPRTLKVV